MTPTDLQPRPVSPNAVARVTTCAADSSPHAIPHDSPPPGSLGVGGAAGASGTEVYAPAAMGTPPSSPSAITSPQLYAEVSAYNVTAFGDLPVANMVKNGAGGDAHTKESAKIREVYQPRGEEMPLSKEDEVAAGANGAASVVSDISLSDVELFGGEGVGELGGDLDLTDVDLMDAAQIFLSGGLLEEEFGGGH